MPPLVLDATPKWSIPAPAGEPMPPLVLKDACGGTTWAARRI